MGLRQWYVNITITIQAIFHRPVFYLKQNISEPRFCLRLKVEPTQLRSINRAVLGETTSSVYCTQLSMFHLNAEAESSLGNSAFEIRNKTI
jgi:hypothetical protein